MKNITIPTITFVIGVALGVTGMIFAIQKGPDQVIANLSSSYTRESAVFGTLLYQKRYDVLTRLIELDLLNSLNFQKGLKIPAPNYLDAQRSVRAYFDATGRPVPPSIEEHIRNIPKESGAGMLRFTDEIAQRTK